MTDEELLASLVDGQAARPDNITAGESLLGRLAVLLTAPAWTTAIVVAAFGRAISGKRPIIVLHERVGHRRKRLWIPKMATAAVQSNERRMLGLVEVATGPPVDLDVDGRFERWLRVTGLDELPQLLLVLWGSMRVVGPRPVTPTEIEEMLAELPPGEAVEVGVDHLQPGLIGLWQVLDRHAYELSDRRRLDLQMVDSWSPRLRRRLLAVALRQAADRALQR